MTNNSSSNFKREKGCILKKRSGNKERPVAVDLLYRVKPVLGRKICKHVNTGADACMIQLPGKFKERQCPDVPFFERTDVVCMTRAVQKAK